MVDVHDNSAYLIEAKLFSEIISLQKHVTMIKADMSLHRREIEAKVHSNNTLLDLLVMQANLQKGRDSLKRLRDGQVEKSDAMWKELMYQQICACSQLQQRSLGYTLELSSYRRSNVSPVDESTQTVRSFSDCIAKPIDQEPQYQFQSTGEFHKSHHGTNQSEVIQDSCQSKLQSAHSVVPEILVEDSVYFGAESIAITEEVAVPHETGSVEKKLLIDVAGRNAPQNVVLTDTVGENACITETIQTKELLLDNAEDSAHRITSLIDTEEENISIKETSQITERFIDSIDKSAEILDVTENTAESQVSAEAVVGECIPFAGLRASVSAASAALVEVILSEAISRAVNGAAKSSASDIFRCGDHWSTGDHSATGATVGSDFTRITTAAAAAAATATSTAAPAVRVAASHRRPKASLIMHDPLRRLLRAAAPSAAGDSAAVQSMSGHESPLVKMTQLMDDETWAPASQREVYLLRQLEHYRRAVRTPHGTRVKLQLEPLPADFCEEPRLARQHCRVKSHLWAAPSTEGKKVSIEPPAVVRQRRPRCDARRVEVAAGVENPRIDGTEQSLESSTNESVSNGSGSSTGSDNVLPETDGEHGKDVTKCKWQKRKKISSREAAVTLFLPESRLLRALQRCQEDEFQVCGVCTEEYSSFMLPSKSPRSLCAIKRSATEAQTPSLSTREVTLLHPLVLSSFPRASSAPSSSAALDSSPRAPSAPSSSAALDSSPRAPSAPSSSTALDSSPRASFAPSSSTALDSSPRAPSAPSSLTALDSSPRAPSAPSSSTALDSSPRAPSAPSSSTALDSSPRAPSAPSSSTALDSSPRAPSAPSSSTALDSSPRAPSAPSSSAVVNSSAYLHPQRRLVKLSVVHGESAEQQDWRWRVDEREEMECVPMTVVRAGHSLQPVAGSSTLSDSCAPVVPFHPASSRAAVTHRLVGGSFTAEPASRALCGSLSLHRRNKQKALRTKGVIGKLPACFRSTRVVFQPAAELIKVSNRLINGEDFVSHETEPINDVLSNPLAEVEAGVSGTEGNSHKAVAALVRTKPRFSATAAAVLAAQKTKSKIHPLSRTSPEEDPDAAPRSAMHYLLGPLLHWTRLLLRTVDSGRAQRVLEALLRQQTREYETRSAHSLFYFVVQGDLPGLAARLEREKKRRPRRNSESGEAHLNRDKALVLRTDAIGANVIHAAYVYRQYAMARWLVEHYPIEALAPVSSHCAQHRVVYGLQVDSEDMPYTGETVLHIAIVHKSLAETRWLLQFYASHRHSVPGGLEALLCTPAVGAFFRREGSFYCGCYAIHFAACSNSPQLFDTVLAYSSAAGAPASQLVLVKTEEEEEEEEGEKEEQEARDVRNGCETTAIQLGPCALFMRDQYGNNCLHLCVLHRLTGMYSHVRRTATSVLRQEIKAAYGEYLLCDRRPAFLQLRPLPAWHTHSSIAYAQHLNHMALLQGCESWRARRERLWTDMLLVLRRYLPLIVLQALERLRRREEPADTDTGFYFGYSPREASVAPPGVSTLEVKDISGSRERGESTLSLEASQSSRSIGESEQDTKNVSAAALELWLEEVTSAKVRERLEWVLNEDFQSPLTLASAGTDTANGDAGRRGSDEEEEQERSTIAFIITQAKQPRWRYGPVQASLLGLEGIELPYHFSRYGGSDSSRPLPARARTAMRGLVEWICVTESDTSAKIPEVQKIISAKWSRAGLPLFLTHFAARVVLTALITALVCFSAESPSLNPDTPAEMAVTVLYPLVGAALLILFVGEVPYMARFGLEYWGLAGRRVRGAARFDKLLTSLIFCLFCALCYYKWRIFSSGQANVYPMNGPSSSGNGNDEASAGYALENGNDYFHSKLCEALISIACWLHLFYFLMGLEATGPFVLTITKIVGRDVPYFLMFYLIVLMGFGAALTTITSAADPAPGYGWWNLYSGVIDLIQITVNMGVPDDSRFYVQYVSADLTGSFTFFFTLFYAIVVLMFLNLLIAMINNTFAAYIQYNDALMLMAKYDIIAGQALSLWLPGPLDLASSYALEVEESALESVSADSTAQLLVEEEEELAEVDSKQWRAHSTPSPTEKENVADSHDTAVIAPPRLPVFAFEVFDEDPTWWMQDAGSADSTAGASLSKVTVTLLILDPQRDFHEGGSLAVPGSTADSLRIRDLVRKHVDSIDEIVVTLDSHYSTHIAHTMAWVAGDRHPAGAAAPLNPAPFTVITSKDIEDRVWQPADRTSGTRDWALFYARELEKKDHFRLMIWPDHCLLGTPGHAVVHPINEALQYWAVRRGRSVTYVMKGQNLRTEMYSALAAEVEDPTDPSTAMNSDLLARLHTADKVLVCGQALSHVVKCTMTDILRHWHGDPARIHLLEDCSSSVTGFEEVGRAFVKELIAHKVTVLRSTDLQV